MRHFLSQCLQLVISIFLLLAQLFYILISPHYQDHQKRFDIEQVLEDPLFQSRSLSRCSGYSQIKACIPRVESQKKDTRQSSGILKARSNTMDLTAQFNNIPTHSSHACTRKIQNANLRSQNHGENILEPYLPNTDLENIPNAKTQAQK